MEQITAGERVRAYVLEAPVDGAWREVCCGSAIGRKKIDSFAALAAWRVRLRVIQAACEPLIRRLGVFHCG
jgi:alpha-L-fucosidase